MAKHAVVDGSNIATEGRSEPSLAQLRDAVAAFRDEYPGFDQVTVIVDASFEHRVAPSERKAARAAIDANEIITPPAGVIGRGDTFILQVAERASAAVVSNDSFQEFHGTFTWLFDEGRLIGGKPIPAVGWVYVPRAPVRGPVSRRARAQVDTADAQPAKRAAKKAAKKTAKAAKKTAKAAKKTATAARSAGRQKRAGAPGANAVQAWQAHRKAHPVGSSVQATVEEFSSHGAYARSGDVRIYLPLRLLGDPAPRRARDVITVGETRQFVIHHYDDERNGIDAGTMAFDGSRGTADRPTEASESGARPTRSRAAAKQSTAKKTAKKTTRKTAAKKTAKKTAKKATRKTAVQKTAKKAAAKKTTRNTAAKKAAAKKTAKKAAAKKTTRNTAAKKAAAKKTAKKRRR